MGPGVGGASSCPAPHIALVAVARAPAGRRPRPGQLAAGTPAAGEEEEEEEDEEETEEHQIRKPKSEFPLKEKQRFISFFLNGNDDTLAQ